MENKNITGMLNELEAISNKATKHFNDYNDKFIKAMKACHQMGEIFYYGNFKAETVAERELEKILRELGYFYENEDDIIKNSNKFKD